MGATTQQIFNFLNRLAFGEKPQNNKLKGTEMFTFGDPTPMLDKQDIMNFAESRWNGRYYETPVSLFGLANSQYAHPFHSSSMAVKRNVLMGLYKEHAWLSRIDFMRLVQDFLLFGDCYLERHKNMAGDVIKLQYRPAKYVRRGREEDEHVMLSTAQGWYTRKDIIEFEKGSIWQLSQPDVNQEIYGMPEYFSALQSVWLGEAATLYRRKYYMKGHSGYILYMTDAAQEEADVNKLREAMKNSRGLDAFRNLFMYAPNGQKDGIQVIPLADALTKDDFLNIKQAANEDVLTTHRVPQQLLAGVPKNMSGLGDANTAMDVFMEIEIQPLMHFFEMLNVWLGEEVITFNERLGDTA